MPASDQGDIECGASHATWRNGLTARFAGGEFAGWSVGSANAAVAAASPLRLGSNRGEFEAAYVVRIGSATLGHGIPRPRHWRFAGFAR